jgi:transcriptional regulator with XRE-family HTH domain
MPKKSKNDEVENVSKIFDMGTILREARKKADMTQEELAMRIGTKRSYISRIERDAGSIRLSTLVKIIEKGLEGKIQINIII